MYALILLSDRIIPILFWYFDTYCIFSSSQTDEELQSSRRIQIVNEGRQLRVVLLQSSDRGTYRCRGENSAGSVEASARLTVTQTGKERREITHGKISQSMNLFWRDRRLVLEILRKSRKNKHGIWDQYLLFFDKHEGKREN